MVGSSTADVLVALHWSQRLVVLRIAVIRTTRYYRDLWQEISQTTHGSRFSGAAMAHDQNAADQRIDNVQNQRQLHLFRPTIAVKGYVLCLFLSTDYTDYRI